MVRSCSRRGESKTGGELTWLKHAEARPEGTAEGAICEAGDLKYLPFG